MGMEVLGQAGPGRFALVDPDIDPVGAEAGLRQLHATVHELPECRPLSGVVVVQAGFVDPEAGEEVAIGIRVSIEHQKAVLVSIDHQRLFILVGVLPGVLQKISQGGFFRTHFALTSIQVPQIGHSPWCPEILMHIQSPPCGNFRHRFYHEHMATSEQKVLLAMSGGVDSSVAAALLHREGYEVVGVFMRLGSPGETLGKMLPGDSCGIRIGKQGCCSVGDAEDARTVDGNDDSNDTSRQSRTW